MLYLWKFITEAIENMSSWLGLGPSRAQKAAGCQSPGVWELCMATGSSHLPSHSLPVDGRSPLQGLWWLGSWQHTDEAGPVRRREIMASGPGCLMEVAFALFSTGSTRFPEGKVHRVRCQNEPEPGKRLGLEHRLDQDVSLVTSYREPWFLPGRHFGTQRFQLGQYGHSALSPATQPLLSYLPLHLPRCACLGHVP